MTAGSDDLAKCLRCSKLIREGANSISCDDCNGWLHLKCAGLKLKEFKKICSDKNSIFSCRYCTYYKCGKCQKPVYPNQNGVQCDIDDCEKWYHLRCSGFTLAEYRNSKSRLHTEPWHCFNCTKLPFSELSEKEFLEVIKPDLDLKRFYKTIPKIDSFKVRCSVCSRKITKNQKPKSLPCSDCESLVHRKCSNISLPELLDCKPFHLKNIYLN